MRTRSLYLFFTLAAIALGIVVFLLTNRPDKKPVLSEVLPPGAVLVLESDGTGPFWRKLRDQTNFWPSVSAMDEVKRFENRLALLDTLLGSQAAVFYTEMASKPMMFAVYAVQESYSGLLVASVGTSLRLYELREMAERNFGQRMQLIERNIGGKIMYMLVDKLHGETFYFYLNKGLFFGGFDKHLVESVITYLFSFATVVPDSTLDILQKTKGSRVDAHLFIDFEQLGILSSIHASPKNKAAATAAVASIADKALLDVVIKQNELLLSGFSFPSDSSFSQAIANQQPREISLTKVLPFNTRLLLRLGAADFDSFYKSLMPEERLQLLNRKHRLDFGNHFIPYLNEIGLAMRWNAGKQELFFAFSTDNVVALSSFLKQLSSNTNGSFSTSLPLKGYAIAGDLVGELFGQTFEGVNGFHYLMLDQFLIVADNGALLDEIEIHYRRGRTLDQNENFRQFANNLADASNVMLYVNLRDGFDLIQPMMDNKLGYFFNRNIRRVRDFEAVAVQFTAINQMLYTSFVLKYNPDYKEESLVGWRTQLQAPMIARPFIVEDHASPNKMVVAFDATNQMYLIDSDGQIQWRKQLQESPISEVFTVDYYKNGKLQYLFNTATHLYLIDRNGNDVANYPVKLRSRATNGLTLLDYENKKDYRILISCADKITYNYEISGKEVQGWMKPRSSEIVTRALEHL